VLNAHFERRRLAAVVDQFEHVDADAARELGGVVG
jgi:hypothetical protein